MPLLLLTVMGSFCLTMVRLAYHAIKARAVQSLLTLCGLRCILARWPMEYRTVTRCSLQSPAACCLILATAGAGAWTDSRGQIFSGYWANSAQLKTAMISPQQQQLT
jgi:hypothetical protein